MTFRRLMCEGRGCGRVCEINKLEIPVLRVLTGYGR